MATQASAALYVHEVGQVTFGVEYQMALLGIDTVCTDSETEALKLIAKTKFEVILIESGSKLFRKLDLCRAIRNQSKVPILAVISAEDLLDEENWLLAGASDFIMLPIVPRIFRLRVKQQLAAPLEDEIDDSNILRSGPLQMNIAEHEFLVLGNPVNLTRTEFQILELLMRQPHHVFTRERILESIGLSEGVGTEHIIDTHASRIRSKIRKAGGPEVLKVIRSVGFKLADAPARH
jgi:two-component system response regulator RegX3